MNIKLIISTLSLLCLSGLVVQAQTPTADTNRDEILRRALRQATGQVEPAASATTPSTDPALSPVPGTHPANAPLMVAQAPPVPGAPQTTPGSPPLSTNPPAASDAQLPPRLSRRALGAGNPALAPTNTPANRPATQNPLLVPGATLPNPAGAAAPAPTSPAATTPAATPNVDAAASAAPPSLAAAAPDDIIPAGVIDFRAVEINDVLKLYGELVQRTILRPTQLPGMITLKTQTPLTKAEAKQALDTVLALNGVEVIPVGEKFIEVVTSQQANQMGAPFNQLKAKELPELGAYVTHVVQLKYVKPADMVQVLTPFASTIPNPIVPIEANQMLVLRDHTANVKRMLEMVEKVDVPIPVEFISEVIPIKYALASEISAALNSLGGGGGGTTVGAGGGATGAGGGGRIGGGMRSGYGGGGFGRPNYGTGGMYGGGYGGGYGGVTPYGEVTPLATVATPGGVAQPGATGGTFADRLRGIINRASGEKGEIQVIGQTKIIADERTNSLLIFASKTDMETIKKIISQLDVVLAQVLIEAVIIEVTLGPDSRDFGFSYLQHPQSAGKWTGVGSAGAGQFFSPNSFAGAIGTNATAGLSGGFNYLFSYGQDLDVTVTALESSTRAKVLQRPRIQTSHAVQAQLFVGESRPYPTGSYYGGASFGGYASIQQLQIGVTLDVTPLINPDGLVVMDIHQTIENYAGFTEISGVGQVPNTTRKEAAAKVAVRDHDTIMLGGLIETDKSKSGSGVPFLMDIPLLGYLFRSSSTSETRKELIVLIRPTVLPTPEVAALAARAEKDRMPGVKQTEKEILEEEAARIKNAEKHLKD